MYFNVSNILVTNLVSLIKNILVLKQSDLSFGLEKQLLSFEEGKN